MNERITETAKVTVMVGRTGAKRHRAFATKIEGAYGAVRYRHVHLACGCPGSARGGNALRIVADGWNDLSCTR